MILHLMRMRTNVNRNVFNYKKNVNATTQTIRADINARGPFQKRPGPCHL